ncbi:PKD domain-containing protein [Longitalea luteola]|uniref:PKD domain-containing protein n=1 Tax=Longitalea luteola TaxID=2812563 RepID=UPI001A9604E4|nr:hypothetical protein [Longitalea luteola]
MRIVTLLNQGITYCHRGLTPIMLAILFLAPVKIFSQSGNLDQIRNGPKNDPSKNFYDDFDNPTYVNGNAGASNAHYVEGHSISYRSLITGAIINQQYEYVIEYDTKHSGRMAIDYLTHFQRLLPHQQFGHDAEVINPLIFEDGSKEYIFNVKSTNTFPIPAPNQPNANTPVDGMPQNSFNALTAAEKLFTIYNGVITNISYVFQGNLENNATESMTRVRIRFTAQDDSVLLAWGGHIASQIDWGFLNPTTPRSAAGISGSPYHMRQISMNTFPGNVNISGVGNQDRSLSANAVIAPPPCAISPAQLACPETDSLRFFYTASGTNVSFLWSLLNNTANATIEGSNSGSSVKIVPGTGGDFTAGGSFSLKLVVTANGIKDSCTLSPAGTIQNVQVTAAANPTTINLATSNTSQLTATAAPAPNTLYTFSWTQSPTTGGSLSAANISNPVFTATAQGTYRFIVTATQIAAPNCVAKDTVEVTVTNPPAPCGISGPDPVCPRTTNIYKYDPDNNGVANPVPDNFTVTWSFSGNSNNATFNGPLNDTTVSVTAGANCETSYRLKIVIRSTSGLIEDSCFKTVNVDVNADLVQTCPRDTSLACGASTDPVTSTGTPNVPDNGCGIKVYYTDVITRTWIAVDACGNRDTCTQIITVDSCITTNTISNNNARMITNTSPAPATQGVVSPGTSGQVKSQIKNAPAINPKTTSLKTATKELQIQAFPNPFSNTVNFRFVSPMSGRAVLEVFNTQGQRVGIAFDGRVDAGTVKTVQFSTRLNNQALIYKLKIGDKIVRGTVLELKR